MPEVSATAANRAATATRVKDPVPRSTLRILLEDVDEVVRYAGTAFHGVPAAALPAWVPTTVVPSGAIRGR